MGAAGPFPEGGLGDLLAKLQAAQADYEEQAAAIDAAVVEGRAGGGAVTVRINGSLEAEAVHIDPGIIDASDPALLEDMVLAALRDALARLSELRSGLEPPAESSFAGALDLGALVGNLDLGGLLGGVDMNALMGSLALGQEHDETALGDDVGPDDAAPEA